MKPFNILTTPESENIPAVPHDYYPRPQFKRDSYISLNGLWDLVADGEETKKILVPFCPQSSLSGIGETFKKGTVLHYHRRFSLPNGFNRGRVILNIGATDQAAEVFLNGKEIGSHIGGYLPFSFDITEFLADDNELYIKVYDDPHNTTLPYGKQKEKRVIGLCMGNVFSMYILCPVCRFCCVHL
jgi:beta-galactosidase/beta-glucuronidase